MKESPVISDAEWEVMEVLWAAGTATSEQIIAMIKRGRQWNPRTVKTLINRLVKKQAIGFEIEGKRYLYQPRVEREACVRAESRSFLAKFFGDDRARMLCRFVDETPLSKSEIAELRRVLDKKIKGRK